MSSENPDLANRFFYYNPSTGDARTWPMHKLHAMYLVDDTTLSLVFDDSGFGDHMIVSFGINSGNPQLVAQ